MVNEAIAAAGLRDQLAAFIDDLATGGHNHAQNAARAGQMLHMLE